MNDHSEHILLIEDDPAIVTTLRVTFAREGWQLTWLDTVSSVKHTMAQLANDISHAPTAIVLDVGLPDGDGLSLCQQIRHNPTFGELAHLPVLFLTAHNDEVDRILGLEIGADDYCAKPFSPRELVARLKAIWRRDRQTLPAMANSNVIDALDKQIPTDSIAKNIAHDSDHDNTTFSKHLASGHWHYDPASYRLYWNNTLLHLSNTERRLMLTLLSAPERIFSREQLLSAISDHPDHRLARTIDSHIKSLRKQLAHIQPIDVIFTHRGLGYGLLP